ncbi:peptidase [Cycloclasticus sp. 46_120_T64]|nr:peptidase [Cycloclasticus sp. 46_120_T64]
MEVVKRSDLQEALLLCKKSFMTAGFFSLFINFLMLVPAIYMLQLYDRVITSGSESTLLMLTLIVLVLFITMGLLEWARSQILVRVSARLETLLSERLYGAAFKQALYSGGTKASSQPIDDLTGLRQFMTGNGLFAFFDAPWLPIYIAVLFMFHVSYGVMAIITVIILSILAVLNEKMTGSKLKKANEQAIVARGLINKNLRNAEVVESMGMLEGIRTRWQEGAQKVLVLQAKASTHAGAITSVSKTFRMLAQSLILGLGAYLVLQQEITPGLMIAGSILLGRALAPIDLMISSWKGFVAARGQYERLNGILLKIPADTERMSLPAPSGSLDVNGVMVAPPGTRTPVVKGVSFKLNAGESLAIIGPSAAGKSTLARALLGVWPALSGKVRLDGVDVFDWDRKQLGPYIGYLPQDIELFDGTIAENIARFSELDSDKVVAAAKLADVHETILSMPKGYDTVIGSTGGALSGGQRQRVGLARAVFGEPKLILLDEPNSNLDDRGEQALAQALRTLKEKGVTVIVITHRPGVLNELDKVLLMQDGALKAFGPRLEVLNALNKQAQPKAKKVAVPITVPPAF